MARRKKVFNLILGVIIGVCVSQIVKNHSQTAEMCIPANTVRRKFLDPLELIGDDSQNSNERLLFVGVMTAAEYLETRAKTVYNTWGKSVPGKLAFFSSNNSRSKSVPLVTLSGVDDSYPPQKKSFAMLKYMHDHFIDKFEWFMRADDDVYVRTDRLENLLRSVDSRKAWFIGQTGRGNSEEFGLLSLENDENFCMGGPGVLLSRETLKRIAPYIEDCLNNVYTLHEDVELGRCVRRFAGVSCTWSYEMQVILYHNSSGNAAFTGDLKQKEVHRAITLHPIKQPQHMERLHNYVKGLTIQSLQHESILLHRDIASSMNELGVPLDQLASTNLVKDVPLFEEPPGSEKYLGDPSLLGVPSSLNRFRVETLTDVLDWEFYNKTVSSYKDSNPNHRITSSLKEGLTDILREVMDIINLYSKQRGRVIDFKDVFYAYWRLDPVNGVDVILDLLLVYRKYRGHKMTVTVRRHAYVQQTFTGIEIREVDVNEESNENTNETSLPLHQKIIKSISKLSENLQLPAIFDAAHNVRKKYIHFILPLSGRYETFKRFMDVYEEVCIKENELTRLTVVLYKTDEYKESRTLIDSVQIKYKHSEINIVVVNEIFARGRALQYGIDVVHNDELLFCIDVDIVFNTRTLLRIRQNTLKNQTIYFPIVYSLYNPKMFNKTYNIQDYTLFEKELLLDENNGYWRQFGFGLVSLYKSDFIKLGGYNISISGWGLEDVNFYDNALKSNLQIVRSVDPGIVHVYHPAVCDSSLDRAQKKMCDGSEASTFGSVHDLQNYIIKHKLLYN